MSRYISIWFPHLATDWFAITQSGIGNSDSPSLGSVPFVLRAPARGRMIITAANAMAESEGIVPGMVLADARALLPDLQVKDDKPELILHLLHQLAEWCIRFSPSVAIDPPDGLLMDVTGCSHLWGGDDRYVSEIVRKLKARGYDVRVAMADTIGAAWGIARFSTRQLVVREGRHVDELLNLPPEALRLEGATVERLHKLGLRQVHQFIQLPRTALRRRFGAHFLMRIQQAIGEEMETMELILPAQPYQERLPCMEPIVTAVGIEIALRELLQLLCLRLQRDQVGLRTAQLKCYRVDGKIEKVEIGTHRPSHHVQHLFKLFEDKIKTITPALGIELFTLDAPKVEEYLPNQEALWQGTGGLHDERLSELIDRLAARIGSNAIHRYLPAEHYWPERSYRTATSLTEEPTCSWPSHRPRPIELLPVPEPIEVTAPIPDYPPLLFRHRGKLHTLSKAEGPERIEQEWWIQRGQHRDYYYVEDEEGNRFWIFRLGHYHDKSYQWFLHGRFG